VKLWFREMAMLAKMARDKSDGTTAEDD